jgi:oligopeptide transport system permease protein
MKKKVWQGMIYNPVGLSSAVLVLMVILVAAFAPVLSPYPYDAQDNQHLLQAPSREHLMGTDSLGRDLLSRLMYGARLSLFIGILTAAAAMVIGTLYGAISGYAGGWLDNALMRFIDVVYALPDLLLIILIKIMIEHDLLGIFLALSLVSWVTVARIIRGEVLRLRESAYVEAARALGMSHVRILLRHILPNTMGALIVTLTFRIPAAILAESTLSFVGIGIHPPMASWGTLAQEGWSAMKFYPHLIFFPSLAIFATMMAFNFLGDSLRDAFDPQSRPA